MFRSGVVIPAFVLVANVACAGTHTAPIIIYTPAVQPGNACIPDGVGSGEETKTSNGDAVIATGVHGASAARCPDPLYPHPAPTAKPAPEDERKVPSSRCVPERTKVGDELVLPSYGRATVLALDSGHGGCQAGVEAKIVGSVFYHSQQDQRSSTGARGERTAPPVYEPTEQEVQREYYRFLASLGPLKEFHVRHILLGSRADALAALEQIRSGRQFADVAAEVSTDSGSKKRGGDLGWNFSSAFISEFSKVMVSLAPAGLGSEPVKTRFGWHVIEVLDTRSAEKSIPPLLAVHAQIVAHLKKQNNGMNATARVPAKAVCRRMVAPAVSAADAAAWPKGTVLAEVRVDNGRVAEILKLTGPQEYYAAVTDALHKYECDQLDRPAVATQSFDF